VLIFTNLVKLTPPANRRKVEVDQQGCQYTMQGWK